MIAVRPGARSAGYEADAASPPAISYRPAGSGDFRGAPPFAFSVSEGKVRGCLFGLLEGTEYDLRVGDLISRFFTRNLTPPSISGKAVIISGAGVDTNPGTEGQPVLTLPRALSLALPGDGIYLREGIYYWRDINNGNRVLKGGTPDSPITIASYPGERAILDGSDPTPRGWAQEGSLWTTTLSWTPAMVAQDGEMLFPYKLLVDLQTQKIGSPGGWWFDMVNLKLYVGTKDGASPAIHQMAVVPGGGKYNIGLTVRVGGIVIKDLELRYYPYAAVYAPVGNYVWVEGCRVSLCYAGVLWGTASSGSFWTVYRNLMDGGIDPAWPWEMVKGSILEKAGVQAWQSPATDNIVAMNKMSNFNNGITVAAEYASYQNPAIGHDWEAFLNEISVCGDDGLEFDGANVLQRAFDNTIRDSYVGISAAPNGIGPSYFLRNKMQGIKSALWKLGGPGGSPSNGVLFAWHNTGQGLGDGVTNYGGGPYNNHTSRNNIFKCGRYALLVQQGTVNDMDNDLLWSSDPEKLIKWIGPSDKWYPKLADFALATGMEKNGVQADPMLEADLSLSPGSSAIDRGIVIEGVNENYLGGAPDLGASESSYLPPPPPPPTPPLASFTFLPESGVFPLTVQFTDTSQPGGGITSWLWDFGDGATSSEQSPQHTYTAPGDFTVRLTVSGPGGNSQAEGRISSLAPPPPPAQPNVAKIVAGILGGLAVVAVLRRKR